MLHERMNYAQKLEFKRSLIDMIESYLRSNFKGTTLDIRISRPAKMVVEVRLPNNATFNVVIQEKW